MTTKISGASITSPSITATALNSTTAVLGSVDLTTPLAVVDGGTGATDIPPYKMVLGTAQATTSGTSIDFTGIPSWVKRITVMLNGVSTNGTSLVQIQAGAGSLATTGYTGNTCSLINTANTTATNASTAGFIIGSGNTSYDSSAASLRNGQFMLSHISGYTWALYGACSVTGVGLSTMVVSSGNVTLSGTLDRMRLTTVNGTDTFDAGSVNIMYEGY